MHDPLQLLLDQILIVSHRCPLCRNHGRVADQERARPAEEQGVPRISHEHTFLGTYCKLGNSNCCNCWYKKASRDHKWQDDICLVPVLCDFYEICHQSTTKKSIVVFLSLYKWNSTVNSGWSIDKLRISGGQREGSSNCRECCCDYLIAEKCLRCWCF